MDGNAATSFTIKKGDQLYQRKHDGVVLTAEGINKICATASGSRDDAVEINKSAPKETITALDAGTRKQLAENVAVLVNFPERVDHDDGDEKAAESNKKIDAARKACMSPSGTDKPRHGACLYAAGVTATMLAAAPAVSSAGAKRKGMSSALNSGATSLFTDLFDAPPKVLTPLQQGVNYLKQATAAAMKEIQHLDHKLARDHMAKLQDLYDNAASAVPKPHSDKYRLAKNYSAGGISRPTP